MSSPPVYSATGGANIQGRINWCAVTQLLLGPNHKFSSFQIQTVSAIMRNPPMGSTKPTLRAGVIRTFITRSRVDTDAAKGPIKPPVLQCSLLLSHVLKTIRAGICTLILMFIFHVNPRIFHTLLTYSLPAGAHSKRHSRASINMPQDTKATEYNAGYNAGHTCNSSV